MSDTRSVGARKMYFTPPAGFTPTGSRLVDWFDGVSAALLAIPPPIFEVSLPLHHVISGETVEVETRRQYVVFGGLDIDGTGAVNLEGTAELVLAP